MFFEEIKDIKSGKNQLREFGLTMGIILVILGAIALWRGKPVYLYLLVAAGIFIGFGLGFPKPLKPIHKIWMSFSIIIGFFVSRLILSVLFYAVLTPIGLIMRIFGKDILDQRIDKNKHSYWQEVKDGIKSRESYENQY
jgi:multisubunit Na+/H+ antiporter MnhG subunit